MTSCETVSCAACGGRGSKLVMFRRSQANAGGTVERLRAVRRRIACLACSGTGEAQAA